MDKIIKILKAIKNNPITTLSLIIFLIIEYIYIYDICTNENKIFLFKLNCSVEGVELLLSNFKKPITISIVYAGLIAIFILIDKKIRDLFLTSTHQNIEFTKQDKKLIKQLHKKEITDFSSLIIKYLKPEIDKYNQSPVIIDGIEFKPGDNVYVFKDPRETILKIKSLVKVINYLINDNALLIVNKYDRINKQNNTLNPFYTFSKIPSQNSCTEFIELKNKLRDNFDITDFDKEIRPIENRLRKYK